jgi:adenylate cyclase
MTGAEVKICTTVWDSMRIICSFRGTQKVWETPEKEVVFGRSEEKVPIILDLSHDQRVSRMHGRIWEEDGSFWVEDLNSSRGTRLNGVEIKGRGKQQLHADDSIVVGQTTLKIDFGESKLPIQETNYLEDGTFLLPEKHHTESGVAVAKDIDATAVESVAASECAGDSAAERLKMVCDLPFHFATKATLETLLPAIIDQLVEVLPNGESWALVLREPETDALLLKAYRYVHRTYLSETLLRRVMAERKAFIWRKRTDVDLSGSMVQGGIEVGMYAPLLWQGEALGAISTGSRNPDAVFTDEDVRLLVVVGQYAAMAVASHRLQEKLRQESIVKANLLRQFSPKVAGHFLAHRGRLRPGGRRSEVSILNSDIRGFTQMAREMEPDEIVEMLNDYLRVLVPVIFAHDGTVDKFLGDGILAIFGSPEPDPKHRENALRAAEEMQGGIAKLNDARRAHDAPQCEFGIGLHCGEVVHGFLGTAERMEFTVIGDAVNRTARYCAAAGEREVLISPEMHEHVWHLVEAEQMTIATKHGESLVAYRVNRMKKDAGASGVVHQPGSDPSSR